jgi:hypothetical protein
MIVDDIVVETIPTSSGNFGSVLFSDNFARSPDTANPLLPWVPQLGTWAVTGGLLQGSGNPQQYSYAYVSTTPLWTDYMVEGRIQFPAGAFGGGIGGRVDLATGAHYGAWVYPAGSLGGSNVLKLVKFRDWTNWSGVPMQQVTLPEVGTGWHTLRMTFRGNRILVYYDGGLKIDYTDDNYDSRPAYLSGGVSVDMFTDASSYAMVADDIIVQTLPTYGSSGVLTSSAYDGGEGVQWQAISWDAAVGGGTNVCVRTRTADLADQLAGVPWSDCYGKSDSGLMNPNRRWGQYQLQLTSSDPSTMPFIDEIRIFYLGKSNTPPTYTTVTFDNPVPPGSPKSQLNGPFQGIDFGTGKWRWEGAWKANNTNNIYFNDDTGTSRTFTFFPSPGLLVSMRVCAGVEGTLTLTDNLGQRKTQTITTGSMQNVTTGWTQASTTITVQFTAGWELAVDDIVYRSP